MARNCDGAIEAGVGIQRTSTRWLFLESTTIGNLGNLATLMIGCLLLVACKESKGSFVSNCTKNGYSNGMCSCAYDVAKDALDKRQFELYSASVAGDRQRMAKATAAFGLIDGATAASRIIWVEANVETACRGK